MKKIDRRLPDGSYTKSTKKFISEWESIYKPLENIFGWTAVSFGNGVSFETGMHRGPNNSAFLTLTVDECKLIASKCKNEE